VVFHSILVSKHTAQRSVLWHRMALHCTAAAAAAAVKKF
jgi:hypothetical protein